MTTLKKVCPICVLVGVVWLTMLAFKFLGYGVNGELLAMLMGGSAVGISYSVSNWLGAKKVWWKLISIPIGFAVMYSLLNFAWLYFFLFFLAYLFAWAIFRNLGNGAEVKGAKSESIERQLKDCC